MSTRSSSVQQAGSLCAIYIFIKMYVRALRIFAVAFRMGGKVKGRAVALQNPEKGLKTALFMIFIDEMMIL